MEEGGARHTAGGGAGVGQLASPTVGANGPLTLSPPPPTDHRSAGGDDSVRSSTQTGIRRGTVVVAWLGVGAIVLSFAGAAACVLRRSKIG